MDLSKHNTLDLAKSLLGDIPNGESEKLVMKHIKAMRPISQNTEELAASLDTFWDRLADKVASIGGSWPFIGAFFLFLLCWAVLNSVILAKGQVFDPYPFVFLNLMLSMLAAIQAPIIMMSQNRQSEKDRIAAANDYAINLRSEIEIIAVQAKLDRLRGEQHEVILANQQEIMKILARLEGRITPNVPPA